MNSIKSGNSNVDPRLLKSVNYQTALPPIHQIQRTLHQYSTLPSHLIRQSSVSDLHKPYYQQQSLDSNESRLHTMPSTSHATVHASPNTLMTFTNQDSNLNKTLSGGSKTRLIEIQESPLKPSSTNQDTPKSRSHSNQESQYKKDSTHYSSSQRKDTFARPLQPIQDKSPFQDNEELKSSMANQSSMKLIHPINQTRIIKEDTSMIAENEERDKEERDTENESFNFAFAKKNQCLTRTPPKKSLNLLDAYGIPVGHIESSKRQTKFGNQDKIRVCVRKR